MKKALLFLAMIFLVMCFSGCGDTSATDEWPDSGLGAILPVPDSKKIDIGYELEDSFSADIKKANEEEFDSYVSKCKEAGFTIDAESDSDDYIAYNAEGYRVNISFYDSWESISIRLDSPKTNGTFSWPTIGLATLLPIPKTNVGTISIDTSIQFNAWIGETSFEDYKDYVNQSIESGFDVDYSNDEKVFTAENGEGVSLRLEYQGFSTMYISMYAPDKEDNDETKKPESTKTPEPTKKPEATQTPGNQGETGLIDGMRPEFKEAMDSYEAFFDKYCAFMKKYYENPQDLTLLQEYTDYMSQYADTMSKMEALNDGELNAAETKYYVEVTGRITQKLLEITN